MGSESCPRGRAWVMIITSWRCKIMHHPLPKKTPKTSGDVQLQLLCSCRISWYLTVVTEWGIIFWFTPKVLSHGTPCSAVTHGFVHSNTTRIWAGLHKTDETECRSTRKWANLTILSNFKLNLWSEKNSHQISLCIAIGLTTQRKKPTKHMLNSCIKMDLVVLKSLGVSHEHLINAHSGTKKLLDRA